MGNSVCNCESENIAKKRTPVIRKTNNRVSTSSSGSSSEVEPVIDENLEANNIVTSDITEDKADFQVDKPKITKTKLSPEKFFSSVCRRIIFLNKDISDIEFETLTIFNLKDSIHKILSSMPSSSKRVGFLSRCIYETSKYETEDNSRYLEEILFLKESFCYNLLFFFSNEIKTFTTFINMHSMDDFFWHVFGLFQIGEDKWISALFETITNQKRFSQGVVRTVLKNFFLKLYKSLNEEYKKSNLPFSATELLHHVRILRKCSDYPVMRNVIANLRNFKIVHLGNVPTDLTFFENSFLSPFFSISVRNGKLSRSFSVLNRIKQYEFVEEDCDEMKLFLGKYRRLLVETCLNFMNDSDEIFSKLLYWFEKSFVNMTKYADLQEKLELISGRVNLKIFYNIHSFVEKDIDLRHSGMYTLSVVFLQIFAEYFKGFSDYSRIDPLVGYEDYQENFISASKCSLEEVREHYDDVMSLRRLNQKSVHGFGVVRTKSKITRLYFLMTKIMHYVILQIRRFPFIEFEDEIRKFQIMKILKMNEEGITRLNHLICDKAEFMGSDYFIEALFRCQMFHLNVILCFMNDIPKYQNGNGENENVEIAVPKPYICMPETFLDDLLNFVCCFRKISPKYHHKLILNSEIFDLDKLIDFLFFLFNHPRFYRNADRVELIWAIMRFFPTIPHSPHFQKYLPFNLEDNEQYLYQKIFIEKSAARYNFISVLLNAFVNVKGMSIIPPLHQVEVFKTRNNLCLILQKIIENSGHKLGQRYYEEFRKILDNSLDLRIRVMNFLLNETRKYLDELLKDESNLKDSVYQEGTFERFAVLFPERFKRGVKVFEERDKLLLRNLFGKHMILLSRLCVLEAITSFSDMDPLLSTQVAHFVFICLKTLFKNRTVQLGGGKNTYLLRDEFLFKFSEIIINASRFDEAFYYGLTNTPGYSRDVLVDDLLRSLESRVDQDKKSNFVSQEDVNRRKGFAETCKKFTSFLKDLEEYEKCSMEEKETGTTEIPEEFCCGLTYEIMGEPVRLPKSKIVVEKSAILRHLMDKKEDPFTRTPLFENDLVVELELKKRIQEFKKLIKSRKRRKMSLNQGSKNN